jgi:hypothetical protein
MAKRSKNPRTFKVSDAFVYSCRSYVQNDIDNAFLWAVKVLELVHIHGLHLTNNECIYLQDVLNRKKGRRVDAPNKNNPKFGI